MQFGEVSISFQNYIQICGSMIIESFSIPIGLLSEEAQEAKSKEFKKFREALTRKCSRKKTNEDLMRRLLCSTDPFISSMRKPKLSKSKELYIPPLAITLEP